MQTQRGAVSVSGDKGCSPLPGIGRGEYLYKVYICAALRQTGKGRECFLYLFVLNCLQLKIIFIPKEHILR